MKNRPFLTRFGYAVSGIKTAIKNEASFRTQLLLGVAALVFIGIAGASPLWWALFLLVITAVLACELMNTALEMVIDRLHPEKHPLIAAAKDCAAGAVLLFSTASLALAALFIWDRFFKHSS